MLKRFVQPTARDMGRQGREVEGDLAAGVTARLLAPLLAPLGPEDGALSHAFKSMA